MRLSYRPDIDGQRAIAVAIVVAFHAGVPGFTGGFVGVDVFFVISGFLITGLLVGELRETGSISLSRFYARRVRRLLPALALVLASTLLLGAVLLLSVAGEQQDLAKSVLAAALSASNIFFWLGSNYFSLERAGLRIVVVGSTPEFHYSVPQCLLRRSREECSMPRAAVDERRGRAMHVVANTVASNGGAHMFDPLRFFCDDDLCYPTHGRTVMFSDPQHLTAAGSPLLEPDLVADLRWLLHADGGSSSRVNRDGSMPNI